MTRDKKPFAWKETVSIQLNTIDKAGISGVNLLEQAEQEIRRVYNTYASAAGVSLRRIERGRETSENYGATVIYGLELTITYYRADTNYTAAYPTLSFNPGVTYECDDASAWTVAASAANFGSTSTGSGDGGGNVNKMAACRFQANASTTITTINAYVYSGVGGNMQAAIYSDTAGAPGVLLANSVTYGITGTYAWAWRTFYNFAVAVTSGTYYWLVLATDHTSMQYGIVTGVSNQYCSIAQVFGSWPAAFGTGSYNNYKVAVYAGYAGAALTTLTDDYFVFASYIASGYANFSNTAPLNLSSALYKKIRWRYAVDGNAQIQIYLLFTGYDAGHSLAWNIASGYAQIVLNGGASSTLTVGSAAITTGKVVTTIVVANADNTGAVHTGNIYLDFVQIYGGDKVFPNCEAILFNPPIRDAQLEAPGMVGSILQGMGAPSATAEIKACLSIGDWSTPSSGFTLPGSIFATVSQNLAQNPQSWVWLDCGDFAMRVRYTGKSPSYTLQPDLDMVELGFIEFYNGSRNTETEQERFSLQ
jgi:hypothetical protein